MLFSLHREPIDVAALKATLAAPACGGFTSFEGWVRDHNEGRAVLRLEYEAYAPLAVAEGKRVLAEALEQFEIEQAACAHRTGELAVGELAVWVGVSAAHREGAFQACRYIIDEIKRRLPIWKKEYYADGSAEWVNCTACSQQVD